MRLGEAGGGGGSRDGYVDCDDGCNGAGGLGKGVVMMDMGVMR